MSAVAELSTRARAAKKSGKSAMAPMSVVDSFRTRFPSRNVPQLWSGVNASEIGNRTPSLAKVTSRLSFLLLNVNRVYH
uniref:Uncharacterized protein n=1 Tax=Candidatus Kentrum eta TaxID=2126337 RepID=A0A450VGZ3_9GAMM|nr:MAG: hypothetical protein BECKH772C_GA0070978_101561 [Candidatus Kentron sp. H]VFK07548.1 MAG: hypothetical protein BECKH772A_GA0070896_107461 [Candidatus Kentron sp. H]